MTRKELKFVAQFHCLLGSSIFWGKNALSNQGVTAASAQSAFASNGWQSKWGVSERERDNWYGLMNNTGYLLDSYLQERQRLLFEVIELSGKSSKIRERVALEIIELWLTSVNHGGLSRKDHDQEPLGEEKFLLDFLLLNLRVQFSIPDCAHLCSFFSASPEIETQVDAIGKKVAYFKTLEIG